MKRKIIQLIVLSLLWPGLYAQAQEKKLLSLQEAINLSIKHSNQLKNSQAKVEEATAALKEAVQKRGLDVSLSGSYLRLTAANLALKKSGNNNGGNNNSGETPKPNQAMYAIGNVSLPLFTGGRIRYGIQMSEYLEKAAMLDVESQKEEVIQTTIEAFATLFKAHSTVRLVKENLAQSRSREKDLSNMEKNGLLARNDLLKAELQTSDIELSLLDAENNLKLANVNMDLMLGLPVATDLELDTAGIAREVDTRVLDDFWQLALKNRKDLEAISLRTKAANTNVQIVKGEQWPSVQLSGGYIAADIPKVFSVTNALNIGLGVSYNIGSLWKNKAKREQAEAREKQMIANEALLNDKALLEVNQDYYALISNRKKIEVFAKALEQAKENYRIVKNKFDNALATTTELLDADVAQLQASLRYTLSRADAFVAYSKLLQTTGILSQEIVK